MTGSRRNRTRRLLLVGIGVITPVGILVVNASAFVMRHLAQFRLGIAACALISSLVLNGLTAAWLLRLARRRSVPLYLAHPDWAAVLAVLLVAGTSAGAAVLTYIGMQDPIRLPDRIAVITALLALAIPLAFAYVASRVTHTRLEV